MSEVVRLSVWSGPRNISTALMRSWENRSDSIVVDEPLYAHYLDLTGDDHPGRDEVIAAGETDWRAVAGQLVGPVPDGTAVFYQKQMAHHLTADIVDHSWLLHLAHVLLIRDPDEVVASYIKSRPKVVAADLGLLQQASLLDELNGAGHPVVVIDSADFLRDPRRYLEALCARHGLPFEEGMLNWPAGPRESDGVWAAYWYEAVQRSTGFEPYRPRPIDDLPPAAAAAAAGCRPAYDRLYAERWLP